MFKLGSRNTVHFAFVVCHSFFLTFKFEIILVIWTLQITVSCRIAFTLSFNVTILYNHSTMIQGKKLVWVQYYWLNYTLCLNFISFSLMFFTPRIQSVSCIYNPVSHSLISSHLIKKAKQLVGRMSYFLTLSASSRSY